MCTNDLRPTRRLCQDYYFCLTKLSGFSGRSRNKIKYANVKSVSKTVPRTSDMETPTPSSAPNVSEDYERTISSMSVDCQRDDDYKPEDRMPHSLSQGKLNDLIRDLNLSKSKAEILGSRMKQ